MPAVCQPPASTKSPLQSQCSSSSSSASDVDERHPFIQNLLDQLQTSHETRFHACWMFLRFFFLTTSRTSHLNTENQNIASLRTVSFDSQSSTTTEEQGHGLLVWDIAVACLSLSVKLHRDFLDPLLPVYADEYLTLSPHGMSYVDLEVRSFWFLLRHPYILLRWPIVIFCPHSIIVWVYHLSFS